MIPGKDHCLKDFDNHGISLHLKEDVQEIRHSASRPQMSYRRARLINAHEHPNFLFVFLLY